MGDRFEMSSTDVKHRKVTNITVAVNSKTEKIDSTKRDPLRSMFYLNESAHHPIFGWQRKVTCKPKSDSVSRLRHNHSILLLFLQVNDMAVTQLYLNLRQNQSSTMACRMRNQRLSKDND